MGKNDDGWDPWVVR